MPNIDTINGVDAGDISSVNGVNPTLDLSGSASTAPSVATTGGTFGVASATITKSGGGTYTNPNYSAECTLADGTVTVTDANIDRSLESDNSHLAGTLVISDTNASTAERTVSVKAQEFGDTTQSTVGTATYTPVFPQHEFIRIQACDSDGTSTATHTAIKDLRFYTAAGQAGTALPSNLTAADSATDIVVSAGASYSATYTEWKAFDSNLGTWWWALVATAANNWIQIQFEDGTYDTKPIIKSMKMTFYGAYFPTHIKLTGSANADNSSATDYGLFAISAGDTEITFG